MYNFFSKRLNGNRKGFTLVELLVVMAILAVLIAIAVMNMGTTTVSAKVSRHNAQVREIHSAATMWFANNTNFDGGTTGKKVIVGGTNKELNPFFNSGEMPKPEFFIGLDQADDTLAPAATSAQVFTVTISTEGKVNVSPGLMKVSNADNQVGKASFDKTATEKLQGPVIP